MTRYSAYVICTSPRSGSTLLCSLLAATGIAGKPASLFYHPALAEWMAGLEVAAPPEATERAVLDAVFRAAVRKGSTSNGLFGLRQQAKGFPFLLEKLAVACPQEMTGAARFRAVFGPTLFLHLTRPVKIAQAVSYLRAEQTGLWHVAPDGTELERIAPHRPPEYERDKLQSLVALLTAYDRDWTSWFRQEGITPFRISHDDLSADPVGVLRSVLDALGLDRAAAADVTPGVRKLADAISQDWTVRYRAETGQG